MKIEGYLLTDSHKKRTAINVPAPEKRGSDGAELSPNINPHAAVSIGTRAVLFGINPHDLSFTRDQKSAEQDGGESGTVNLAHVRKHVLGKDYGQNLRSNKS